jgi:hypothetical protein
MLLNSEKHPAHVLREQVLQDTRAGGLGRANAILVASLDEIQDTYLRVPPEARGNPLSLGDTILAGNVMAVLDDLITQKYTFLNH